MVAGNGAGWCFLPKQRNLYIYGEIKKECQNIKLHFFKLSRINASMDLERQLKNMDSTVTGFEKKLSNDSAIPDTSSAIQTRAQETQVTT